MKTKLVIGCLLAAGLSTFAQTGFHILPNGRVGNNQITPLNRLHINTDASDPYGLNGSGLRFGNMTSATTPLGSNGKVLTVDANGDVILVNDQTGTGTFLGAENGCSVNGSGKVELGNGNNGVNGQLLSNRYIPQNNKWMIFSGEQVNDRIVFGSTNSPITMEGRVNIETQVGPTANPTYGYGLNIYAHTNAWCNAAVNANAEDFNGNTPQQQIGGRFWARGIKEVWGVYGRAEGNPGGTSNLIGGDFYGLTLTGQSAGNVIGVQAAANNVGGLPGSITYGVKADASNAVTNYAGRFYAANGTTNYGVWAGTSGGPNDWAGYFSGRVQVTGQMWNNATLIFSDKRFKQNINPLKGSVDKLMKINGYSYTFRTNEFKDHNFSSDEQIGLIAQEVKEVFPQLVSEDAEGFYAVNYVAMIPVLLEAIKEQQSKIEALESKLEEQRFSGKSSGETGTTGISDYASTSVQLLQNEPNPFTHETTIKYALPSTVNSAYIAVYDLTGKELSTYRVESGSSSMVFNAGTLPAGIYLYGIVADGKILDTKRMVIAGK